VLYADALIISPLEDIEEHYLNLVRFHALQRVLDEGWKFRGDATSDRDLEHLQKYVEKIKDTKFRQRLLAAVDQFFTHRTDNRLSAEGPLAYETNALAVFYVHHFAENRYGFHFKDTDEFGLYGSFYDDSRDKTYQSLYRSDRKFEAEMRLSGDLIGRYFHTSAVGVHRIDAGLRDSIQFTHANLIDAREMASYPGFDIVFCRNVLIYFNDASRRIAAENLYDCLLPGGYICLGHSETMSRISPLFRVCRFSDAIVYQRPEADDGKK
jgi:SAM-dependent methyltransferase